MCKTNIAALSNEKIKTSGEKGRYSSKVIEVDVENPEETYVISEVFYSIGKDGHLLIVDGNDLAYLYPEQVSHLKEILGIISK